ncbi:MAG: NAD-dependent epimerase/dehydratase family protein [Patescibacteria group bacterium]
MKTLVTGGSGFIGSHLVDALVEAGHEVSIIDLVEPKDDRRNAKAEYIKADIRDPKLPDIIAKISPEIVFHLAAYLDDRASVKEPVECASHNVLGAVNVFESAFKAGTKKIIMASTSVVYGLQDVMPIPETATPKPMTPYGVSKLIGERYLAYYANERGLETASVRFGNVYGPRQDGSKEYGAITIFANKLLRGEQISINNDGMTLRDYVHVSDIVSALMTLGQNKASGEYNCGTGIETSTIDVYKMVAEAVGSKLEPLFRPEVPDAMKRSVLASNRLASDFGWKPKVALAEGIASTIAWYKERL